MSASHASTRRKLRALSPASLLEVTPWAAGAGLSLVLLVMFTLTRIAMALIGARQSYFGDLEPVHALWLGPALARDLAAAAVPGLVFGALLWVAPRVRVLTVGLLYLFLLFTDLVCLVSVPTYGAMHTTVLATQLLLAGGVKDLLASGLDVISRTGFAVAIAIILASLFLLPTFARLVQLKAAAAFGVRTRIAAVVACVAMVTAGAWAPVGGAAGLEVNALGELVASAIHFAERKRGNTKDVDMTGAPHFDASPMYGNVRVEATETLLDTTQLPLRNANVVLIVLESSSVNELPLWGGKEPLTPRMEELAEHGLVFEDYYTVSPVSMKSLFTLSCSTYPYPDPKADTYVNPSMECLSISELLKARGYRTGLFHGGGFGYTDKDEFFKYRKFDVMRDANTLVHRTKYGKVPWGADDRAVIDDAVQWLEQTDQSKPFFLNLIFLAPHHPYSLTKGVPTPYGTKNDLSRYRNATMFIDAQVGRVWDFLKAKGKVDDTLIVIVSDHGEAFGEHTGHFTHGTRIYEETARTPMMMVNPKLFHGQRTKRVGNHVDLVPTMLDVLGMKAEPRHQGKSLLRGHKPRTIYFYADWYKHLLGLRDGPWKFIYDADSGRPELYDLTRDPREKNNLAAAKAPQVARYEKRVLGWEEFYRELIPNYEHYVVSGGFCGGRSPCYLDELRPVLQKGAMRRKRSVGGDMLRVGKYRASRGVGVETLSILRYNLRGGGFRTLSGAVGHHIQERNANLSLKVSAEIYLDDMLLWSSGKLDASEQPKAFELNVNGGSVLELIGYDVDGETWRDYMDWLDIRLER